MRWHRIGLVSLLLAAIVATPSGAHAPGCAPDDHPGGEWRSFGHDLANTRHQDAEDTIDAVRAATLVPAWAYVPEADGGDFSGTPVVADGCVFAGSNTGLVVALDADHGGVVWQTRLDGPVKSTVAVEGGRVFVTVSRVGTPFAAALDIATGDILWQTVVDEEPGSETYGSPVPYDGFVFVGVSGVSPESEDADPLEAHHGNFNLLDAETGDVLKKTYTIPEALWADGFAGGGLWPTPAIDTATGYAYAATGNPYRDDREHEHVNAIVKIDLDRDRATFGEIVDAFKPLDREMVPGVADLPPCRGTDRLPLASPAGDPLVPHLDFGASPNLFRDPSGRLVVGDGQKSGHYYALDAETFELRWRTLVGPYGPFGGIVSSAAYDGTSLVGGVTPAGYLFALDPGAGDCRWLAPVADGVHYGHPVASANGVVYTVDVKGFLDAYDAATGAPVLHAPMWLATGLDGVAATFGGVSVARNTVFAALGLQVATGNRGAVVAYRPAL